MAEDQDQSQKTEEPTAKKLEDARQKGQVASSKEIANLLLIGSATLTIGAVLPAVMRDLATSMSHYLRHAGDLSLVGDGLGNGLWQAVISLGLALLIPLAITTTAAIVAPVLQHAALWSAESLTPKLERISPLAGAKRLFSLKSIVEFLKGVIKISLMAAIGVAVLWPSRQRLVAAGYLEVAAALELFVADSALGYSGHCGLPVGRRRARLRLPALRFHEADAHVAARRTGRAQAERRRSDGQAAPALTADGEGAPANDGRSSFKHRHRHESDAFRRGATL